MQPQVIKYFGMKVDAQMKEVEGVWTEDDVMEVLEMASHTWRDPAGDTPVRSFVCGTTGGSVH